MDDAGTVPVVGHAEEHGPRLNLFKRRVNNADKYRYK